jgi:hypothetical protein
LHALPNYIFSLFQLNRSDSDSAMSHHKRLAFQRNILERRSLRVPPIVQLGSSQQQQRVGHTKMPPPSHSVSSPKSSKIPSLRTAIDLELDLAAQQSKLTVLHEEIERLKDIKARLVECKEKGAKELPSWLQEHEQFQQMLTKVRVIARFTGCPKSL